MTTQNNKDSLYNECGSLMLFNKATNEDIDLLITLLCRGNNSYIELLRNIINDNMSLLKLFDCMSGQKVQFPDRKKIFKTLEKVFIYNYCKQRNFSETSYIAMSKQYGKRIPQTKAIVNTMQKFIDSNTNKDFEELTSKEELDEFNS